MPDTAGGAWTAEHPVAADAWKRAVYKRPPKYFHVTLRPPEKHGSSYSYGFRVHPTNPIKDDNASIITRTSSSECSVAHSEYEIWRKWEDCLYFQDTLEIEYTRAAREKRNRLAAGKGVKKNGVYIHSDQAASWESLPFGPDPNDIARDIHHYVPKLTKKGTLFRASQETVNQRYEELQKMMDVLLQDDLPTLVKEIKATLTFSDFFGVWRRDIDLARKKKSSAPTADRSRPNNIPSSFSASSLSLPSKSPSQIKGKGPQKPFGIFHSSDASSSEDCVGPPRPSRMMHRNQQARSVRSSGSSSDSHSSSSLPSTPVNMSRQLPPTSRQPVIPSQEVTLKFEHNPHAVSGEGRSYYLESLPEDRELASSPKSEDGAWARRRTGSTASRMNRGARIYVSSPSNSSSEERAQPSARAMSRYSTASLKSMSSATLKASAYLDELGVDYCLPSPTPDPWCRSRASISSMASVVTNASVDAVIPRNERPAGLAHPAQRPRPLSQEPWEKHEPWSEDESDEQADILDAYFADLIRPHAPTPDCFPETPASDEMIYRFPTAQSSTSATFSSFSGYSDRRSSFATSISSGSTCSSGDPMALCIKAMHEDNIVLLRVPRYITFDSLRRKLFDKFMQTEGATICETFAIALLEQPPSEKTGGTRPRAGSMSSLGSVPSRGVALHFISSQDEWNDVVATHSSKMLLRIIGSRS